ncbi:cysteine desulfurase [Evansella vedderi]|uniref:cysteine desulfurase n=1 Tax=Evansella vedderi TaxID=38282 RepID=A0ABT9ZX39_9BACI|nr:cysteine desulfurase family protein [Evansella vedderi]MDQ0255793.1 cysteine desulfurase [Evansella vedderi]
MNRIYLDYNASTPIDPEVIKVMTPLLESNFGNPSTSHWAAKNAKEILNQARSQVAALLSAKNDEIIFTSGGSESNNHAIKGVYYALRNKGKHIITSSIEHPAVKNPLRFLEGEGAKVTYLPVDSTGRVHPAQVEAAITKETILISIMHSNNEVGTLQPIKEIAAIAKRNDILIHTDASQSIGKVPVSVKDLNVDLLTIAGHKLYAPKGFGALFIRENTPIETFIHGAGHEGGRRAGTENIFLAAGLGKACELAKKDAEENKIEPLRNYFWKELSSHYGSNIVLNGEIGSILPNTLNVSFKGYIGQDVLEQIPEIAASTGAACHSGKVQLSEVLEAMGVTKDMGKGTIRFSLGRYTTKEEIDQTLALLKDRIPKL